MWARNVVLAFVGGSGLVLAGACGSDDAEALRRAQIAEGCLINTDCQSPLVCAFRTCHVQCDEQRDCPEGELCVPTDKPFKVCMFQKEQECEYHTDCPAQFKCVFSKCRPECKTDKDCVPDQRCGTGSCAVQKEVGPDGELIQPGDASTDSSLGQSCVYSSDCYGTEVCIGGTCLPQCKTDKDCASGWRCNAAQVCEQLVPDAAADGGSDATTDGASDGGPGGCANGALDPGETGVDCGGPCGACAGAACTKPSDCASHVCVAQKCGAPSCTDGLQNGTESDIDCGGTSCSKCPAPKGCWTSNDCVEGSCVAGICTSPGCTDGTKSGNETDVDCGGPTCNACTDGKACLANSDCSSGNCVSKVCKPAGPVTWAQSLDGKPRVASDPTGNLVVAGEFSLAQTLGGVQLQTAGSWDLFAAKLTPAGAPLWVWRVGGTSQDTLGEVVSDSKGNVILAGETYDGGSFTKPLTCGTRGVFLIKLAANDGSHIWSHCVALSSSSDATVYAVTVDASDDVYFGGTYHGLLDFGGTTLSDLYWQGFVAKYSGVTGDMAWSRELPVSSGAGTRVASLAGDGSNVLAVGDFTNTLDLGTGYQLTSTGNVDDVYVARFSGADGSTLLSKRFGDAGVDTAGDVARDGTAAVVVTGTFNGLVDFGTGAVPSQGKADAFLLRLDPTSFAPIWAKGFGSAEDDRGISVAVASSSEIALAAEIEGPVNFGGGPLTFVGSIDFALARFSPSGGHLYSKSWGGLYNETVSSVVWVGKAVGLAGQYNQAPIDFGTGALPTSDNAFFAHLVP